MEEKIIMSIVAVTSTWPCCNPLGQCTQCIWIKRGVYYFFFIEAYIRFLKCSPDIVQFLLHFYIVWFIRRMMINKKKYYKCIRLPINRYLTSLCCGFYPIALKSPCLNVFEEATAWLVFWCLGNCCYEGLSSYFFRCFPDLHVNT